MADGAAVVPATVGDHDPETGCGTLLLDDGTRVTYDAAAFSAGGLRLLRSGQRVHVGLVDGVAVSVTLPV